MDHGQRTFAVRGEGQLWAGVEGAPVDALADRQRREQLAGRKVDHGHQPVRAPDEQPFDFPIDCQASRFLTGCQRPSRRHGQGLGVDRHQFSLVLDVDEDSPLPVMDRKFGFAAQPDRPQHGPGRGIERGRVGAAAVKREHPAGGGLIDDRIRIPARHLDSADHRQGCQVEDRDGGIPAITGKPPMKIRGQGNPMHPRRVRNVAHDRIAVGIDDHHMGAVGHVEPMSGRVDGEIVPATIATNRNLLGHVIGGTRRLREYRGNHERDLHKNPWLRSQRLFRFQFNRTG